MGRAKKFAENSAAAILREGGGDDGAHRTIWRHVENQPAVSREKEATERIIQRAPACGFL